MLVKAVILDPRLLSLLSFKRPVSMVEHSIQAGHWLTSCPEASGLPLS